MIRAELFAPKRIVVAGGSEQRSKPDGKLLQNLLEGGCWCRRWLRVWSSLLGRLSTLLRYATEIKELDLNPLIGTKAELLVVDARMLLRR